MHTELFYVFNLMANRYQITVIHELLMLFLKKEEEDTLTQSPCGPPPLGQGSGLPFEEAHPRWLPNPIRTTSTP